MIDYNAEIGAFLSNERQRVLMLEGPWGIGKSYYWRRFISENQNEIKEAHYAYVSLFGLSDLQSLKGLLLTNAIGASAAEQPSVLTNIRRRVGDLSNVLRQIEIPWIKLKLETVLPNIEELLIKDFLICLDDLERRNKGLEIDELLGFISRLRENNGCRIVLICNTNELGPEDKKAIERFREKIIDRHIAFAPLLNANFRLVFGSSYSSVMELFKKVELNNIRVMQQTKWAIDYFGEAPNRATETVQLLATDQIARLSIVHYAFSSVMDVAELGSRNWMVEFFHQRENGKTDSSNKLNLVQKLGYEPSSLDPFIITYLKDGFCEKGALAEVIQNLNVGDVVERGKHETHLLWALVYSNFAITESEIVERFQLFISTFGETVHVWSIYQFSELLDQLKIPYQRGQVQELMKRRISNADVREIGNLAKSGKWSADLTELIKKRQDAVATTPPIESLVEDLSQGNGWNPEDFNELDEYTEDELYEWIVTARNDDVIHAIREVLQRASMAGGGGQDTEIAEKLRDVLERIAATSALNNLRVKKYVEKAGE